MADRAKYCDENQSVDIIHIYFNCKLSIIASAVICAENRF